MTRVRLKRRVLLSAQVRTALTIAGSDSGGGAGIQADLKSFASIGVHGTSVITCVTAQNTRAVDSIFAIPTAEIRKQLRAVLDDFDVRAAKTGMLYSAGIVRLVRLGGRRYRKALHGAGCTLAASTAAYLALGHPLLESVRRARRKVAAGFRASYRAGHGVEIINSQITGGR